MNATTQDRVSPGPITASCEALVALILEHGAWLAAHPRGFIDEERLYHLVAQQAVYHVASR